MVVGGSIIEELPTITDVQELLPTAHVRTARTRHAKGHVIVCLTGPLPPTGPPLIYSVRCATASPPLVSYSGFLVVKCSLTGMGTSSPTSWST
mgnify:CR=1 FL=1